MRYSIYIFIACYCFIAVACDESDASDEAPPEQVEEAAVDDGPEQPVDTEADRELADDLGVSLPCESDDDGAQAGAVRISNFKIVRTGLDLRGVRLAGCVHNEGEEVIDLMKVIHRGIPDEDARPETVELHLGSVEPGDSALFVSKTIERDEVFDAGLVIDGYRIESAAIGWRGEDVAFEPVLEAMPALPERPEHELEAVCAEIDAAANDAGDSELSISEARLEYIAPSASLVGYLVGCVTNHGDETLADDDEHRIAGSYEVRSREGGTKSGLSNLLLTGAIEPGESAFFVSDFRTAGQEVKVEFEPDAQGTQKVVVEH